MINLFSNLILFSLIIMTPANSFMEQDDDMMQEDNNEIMTVNEEDAEYSSGDEDMNFSMSDDGLDEEGYVQNQDEATIDESPEFMDDSDTTNIEGYSFEEEGESPALMDNEMNEEQYNFESEASETNDEEATEE